MHNYEVQDDRDDMWKRYDQIFNLRKFKADAGILDADFDDSKEDAEN